MRRRGLVAHRLTYTHSPGRFDSHLLGRTPQSVVFYLSALLAGAQAEDVTKETKPRTQQLRPHSPSRIKVPTGSSQAAVSDLPSLKSHAFPLDELKQTQSFRSPISDERRHVPGRMTY
ncbi:hypothetical protein N658DRAFT_221598 [Parathielavia hyrcaniae]|uniref:Uncharacterized protein n=1 Tax=Parathielavia hyrcaniae TaxID=113614 RepID=A0AAN6PV72_9PEZI|nr:hypothetical protein N658DRAFT_221598 [Parathielavia hyrcaniae]